MAGIAKLEQLQLRVSKEEKAAIRRAAARAGMDMSAFVLDCVLPAGARAFQAAVAELAGVAKPAFALAAINTLLSGFSASELRRAVAERPEVALSPLYANYLAAMVEVACHRHSLPPPAWTRDIPAVEVPVFGSALPSLRLYLLTHSPAPFRGRNLFVDASIGDQV